LGNFRWAEKFLAMLEKGVSADIRLKPLDA